MHVFFSYPPPWPTGHFNTVMFWAVFRCWAFWKVTHIGHFLRLIFDGILGALPLVTTVDHVLDISLRQAEHQNDVVSSKFSEKLVLSSELTSGAWIKTHKEDTVRKSKSKNEITIFHLWFHSLIITLRRLVKHSGS